MKKLKKKGGFKRRFFTLKAFHFIEIPYFRNLIRKEIS
jgi:hypothetical protein